MRIRRESERKLRIMKRMMRASALLSVLLTPPQQGILAATLLQPEKRWYLRELARHLEVQPSTLQRELSAFASAGLLQRREDGNRIYYQADRGCPIYPELESILLKTVGLAELLQEALQPLAKQLALACVYGSMAAQEEHSDSDVDLLVVGQVGLAEIAMALRGVGRQIGREVNPTVYTTEEFQKKAQEGSHFVSTVLASELLFVSGTRDDLERLAPATARQAAPHEPARGSRSPRRRRA